MKLQNVICIFYLAEKSIIKMNEIQENLLPENQQATTLDADLKRIREAKYDVGLESDVCRWIGQIIGRPKSANESAASWMKSGDILCQLMNTLRPGTIKKYNVNTTSKFKQMENITLFLRACREVGMLEKDLFSTIDLFEAKDMNAVILSLFNLGGTIQSTLPYFKGPKLGIKQTNRNFPVVPQLEAPAPPPVVAPIVDPAPVVIAKSYVEPAPLPPVALSAPSEPAVPPQPTAAALPASPAAAISMSALVRPPLPPAPLPDPVEAASVPPAPRLPDVVSKVLSPPMKPSAIQATVASIPSAKILPPPASPPRANPVLLRDPLSPPRSPPASKRETIPTSSARDVGSSVSKIEMDIKPRKRTPLSSKQIIRSTKSAVQQRPASVPEPVAQQPNYLVPPNIPMPQLPVHPAALGQYQSYGSHLLKQVSAMNNVPQMPQHQVPQQSQKIFMYPQQPMMRPMMPQRKHLMPGDASEESLVRAVVEWIEAIICENKHQSLPLYNWLASGEVLCRLANVILGASPNPHIRIPNIARMTDSANHQKENAKKFTDICRLVGVSESDLFSPSDLYEGRDLGKVVRCVMTLGGILQNYEWWVNSPYAQLGKRIRIQSVVKV